MGKIAVRSVYSFFFLTIAVYGCSPVIGGVLLAQEAHVFNWRYEFEFSRRNSKAEPYDSFFKQYRSWRYIGVDYNCL